MLVLEETTYDREWVFGTHLCLLLNFTVNQNYLETGCIQWNSENCIRDLVYDETKDIDMCHTNENHRDLLSSQEDDVQQIVDEVYAIEQVSLAAGWRIIWRKWRKWRERANGQNAAVFQEQRWMSLAKATDVKRVNTLKFRSRGDNPLQKSSIPMQHSFDGAGKLMATASVSTDTVVPFTC